MRPIDLDLHWLRQYEGECTVLPAIEAEIPANRRRLGQLQGYLQDAAVAVIPCGRGYGEIDPGPALWLALSNAFARVEAEFPGRVLADADDLTRWREDPQGLAWAVPSLPGLDLFARDDSDLERLRALYVRGLRVVRLHSGESGESVLPTGNVLDFLAGLASEGKGPRPALDLAGAPPDGVSEVLDWYEFQPDRASRLLPCLLGVIPEMPGMEGAGAMPTSILGRVRNLSGLIGLRMTSPLLSSPELIRSAIDAVATLPFDGRPGLEGIALATSYLAENVPGDRRPLSALLTVLNQVLPRTDVATISQWNARIFLSRLVGGS